MAALYRGLIKRRAYWILAFACLFFAAIAVRLAQIQVVQSSRYSKWAKAIRYRVMPISAARGAIYDRTGRALALSIDTASVFANKNEVKDRALVARRIAAILGEDPGVIEAKFNGRGSIVWLAKRLDPRLVDGIRREHLVGVGIERDTKRVYPGGALAASVLGFTNVDNKKGLEGLECSLNKFLTGKEGEFRAELDGERRVIPETRFVNKQPEQGKNVYLTIDSSIQHISEQALGTTVKMYRPDSACAIVMDPRTGEILALANYPGYDPNKPFDVDSKVWRNRAVADLYEPGSTLKAVTVAASLNEGIDQYQVVAQCTGKERSKGFRIKCVLHYPFGAGHGGVDMYKIIQQSCNIGAAHLAFRLGSDKLFNYEKSFGLLSKIDTGFGCEVRGQLPAAEYWGLSRLANVGFGQGISVTALHMASVYSTIANRGVYVEPQIIKEIRNSDGSIYQPFKVRGTRRVVSEKAAFTATKMLMSCVQVGTGKPAKIVGRSVAGKTGSAEVASPKGGYEQGVFIASFIGFAPAKNPRLVIAVIVNRPKGSHWGAAVAAPAFHDIGEKALWYLRVPADQPTGPTPGARPKSTANGLA